MNLEEFPAGSGNRRSPATDVSAQITSDQPIIVERAMYLSTPAQIFGAGHESAGVTAPALELVPRRGRDGQLLRPVRADRQPERHGRARSEATYLLPDGTTLAKDYTVPANSRFNIWVDEEQFPDGSGNRLLANTAVSTTIRSTNGVPVIVERAMWWPGPTPATWAEAHNSPGRRRPARGGRWPRARWAARAASRPTSPIANTSAFAGQAKVTLLLRGRHGAGEATVNLPAQQPVQRVSAGDVPGGIPGGRQPAVRVDRREPGRDAGADRRRAPMYSDASGVAWAAGTNALATRLQ